MAQTNTTVSTAFKKLSTFTMFLVLFIFNISIAHSSKTGLEQQPIIQGGIGDIDPSHFDSLIESAKKKIKKVKKGDDEALSVASAGSAPGISYFEVFAVGSSNVGWEYPQHWQTTTNQNHGGNELWIAVAQIGYGNVNQASLNGLFRSPFRTDPYCSGGGWHICNPGETIEAWMYYFSFDGQEQGLFSNSTNSIAFPFGYWSDSIYIQ